MKRNILVLFTFSFSFIVLIINSDGHRRDRHKDKQLQIAFDDGKNGELSPFIDAFELIDIKKIKHLKKHNKEKYPLSFERDRYCDYVEKFTKGPKSTFYYITCVIMY